MAQRELTNKQKHPFERFCPSYDLVEFYGYFRSKLSDQEREEIDIHATDCMICLAKIAKMREILDAKNPMPDQESLKFLEFFETSVWVSIKHNLKNEFRASLEDKDKDKEIAEIKEVQKQLKSTFKGIHVTVTLLVLCFISLAYVVAFLTKRFYDLPASIKQPDLSIKLDTSNQTAQNLYEELDALINDYIQGKNNNLDKASQVAIKMKNEYFDSYGTDLIIYYSRVENSKLKYLGELRKKLNILSSYGSGSDYEKCINEALELKQKFLDLGDRQEALKAELYLVKFSALSYAQNTDLFLEEGLGLSQNYPALNVQFSLWQTKLLLDTEDSELGKKQLEEIIEKSRLLQLEEVRSNAIKSLVGLYYLENDDQKAFYLAQQVLPKTQNIESRVSLLHICSVTAFKLHLQQLSKTYMDEALELSSKNNNLFLVGLSYTFQGMIEADSGNHQKAESEYQKALSVSSLISNEIAKKDLIGRVSGYQGKNLLLQGNYTEASICYEKALKTLQSFNKKAYLEIAELNKGLATALNQTKNEEAGDYYATASLYLEKAKASKMKSNCFLSFIPSSCTSN